MKKMKSSLSYNIVIFILITFPWISADSVFPLPFPEEGEAIVVGQWHRNGMPWYRCDAINPSPRTLNPFSKYFRLFNRNVFLQSTNGLVFFLIENHSPLIEKYGAPYSTMRIVCTGIDLNMKYTFKHYLMQIKIPRGKGRIYIMPTLNIDMYYINQIIKIQIEESPVQMQETIDLFLKRFPDWPVKKSEFIKLDMSEAVIFQTKG